MKVIRIYKKDIQTERRNKDDTIGVFRHLQNEYSNFTKHLRQMSELLPRVQGSEINKTARQKLAKKMVGMADSMQSVWEGLVREYSRL